MSGIAAILTMAMTLQLPTVEPTAVERTAIRSRNAIKSGVITLRCSHVGPLGKPVTTAYEFQFDGSNRFMEIAVTRGLDGVQNRLNMLLLLLL